MTDAPFAAQIRNAIRSGTYVPVDKDGIVALCRLTAGHAGLDYDAADLVLALAHAVRADGGTMTGEGVEIGRQAAAMLASAAGMASRGWRRCTIGRSMP